ncbi:hypothetical protein NQT62_01355 [Limnobacter humi]|uniref:Uncharacterized protein n=1 Tax=Limnobacter humi TaxID=1778671 RepID=A0ABT1WC43_9BURK|nr:hypothetical protein [Limnobacter humi]MCQ8895082.1 hypothetical protein [Limnobacter humi]
MSSVLVPVTRLRRGRGESPVLLDNGLGPGCGPVVEGLLPTGLPVDLPPSLLPGAAKPVVALSRVLGRLGGPPRPEELLRVELLEPARPAGFLFMKISAFPMTG